MHGPRILGDNYKVLITYHLDPLLAVLLPSTLHVYETHYNYVNSPCSIAYSVHTTTCMETLQ